MPRRVKIRLELFSLRLSLQDRFLAPVFLMRVGSGESLVATNLMFIILSNVFWHISPSLRSPPMPSKEIPNAPLRNFVRTAYHACGLRRSSTGLLLTFSEAIALGDYVFIDGGKMSKTTSGSVLNT